MARRNTLTPEAQARFDQLYTPLNEAKIIWNTQRGTDGPRSDAASDYFIQAVRRVLPTVEREMAHDGGVTHDAIILLAAALRDDNEAWRAPARRRARRTSHAQNA